MPHSSNKAKDETLTRSTDTKAIGSIVPLGYQPKAKDEALTRSTDTRAIGSIIYLGPTTKVKGRNDGTGIKYQDNMPLMYTFATVAVEYIYITVGVVDPDGDSQHVVNVWVT